MKFISVMALAVIASVGPQRSLSESMKAFFETRRDELARQLTEVWSIMVPGQPLPSIVVSAGGKTAAPYLNGDRLYFPYEYSDYARILSMLLGHDVYVKYFGSNDLTHILLYLPFDKSRLIPILAPLTTAVTVGGIVNLRDLLTCPAEPMCAKVRGQEACPVNPPCAAIADVAAHSVWDFIIAHEVAHLALHHERTVVGLPEEIAADRAAWDFIHRVHQVPSGVAQNADDAKVRAGVSLAIEAGPLLVTELNLDASEGTARQMLESRRDALYGLIAPSFRDEVRLLVTPERTSRMVKSVTIKSSESVDWILVDGLSLPPGELLNRSFLLSEGSHTLFAQAGRRFAYRELQVSDQSQTEVTLPFRAVGSCDRLALQENVDQKLWFQVFLCTSKPDLEPRSAELMGYFIAALHELGLEISSTGGSAESRFHGYVPRRPGALASWGDIEEIVRPK